MTPASTTPANSWRERALSVFPGGSNGEFGLPPELVPVLDRKRGQALMLELFRTGVFLNPMGTKLYLSLAHNDAAIDEFADCFARAVKNTRPAEQREPAPA